MASLTELFTSIANAIRSKTGGTEAIKATDFPSAIEGISAGGGVEVPMVKITFEVSDTYPVNISYMTVKDNALVSEMVSGTSGEIDVVADSHINIWTETPNNPFGWKLTVDNIESSSGEWSYAMYTCWGDQSDIITQPLGDDHMIITTHMG